MARLNVYYRAFKDYRKHTTKSKSCQQSRRTFAKTDAENDKLEAIKYLCTIEEDWVKAIEEGLPFVEKAVAEERQFIRTNGEIVPIEKVKKVSKESVSHLARHSNMITHVPEKEGDTIVPDKLYFVEKLSDYAIYENRFLYMMLSYVQSFIVFRLDKIETLRKTYVGNMEIVKNISSAKRSISYELKIHEERKDNPYPIMDEKSADILRRIKDCLQIVNALMNTDLISQVAKSPMIKPPIVKTNVLKMNNNFKNALALYEYLASYEGIGFSSEEVRKEFVPFKEDTIDEIADAVDLLSFLSYKEGNEIEGILETAYLEEEEEKKRKEALELAEKIKRMRKQALESGKTMEEYMLLLEKRNRQLEHDSEELVIAKNEITNLHKHIDELNLEKLELERKIEELQQVILEKIREIEALNRKYIEDMAALRRQHEIEVAELKRSHEIEVDTLNSKHEEELFLLSEQYATERKDLISSYEEKLAGKDGQIESLTSEVQEARKQYESKVEELATYREEAEKRCQAIIEEYDGKMRDNEQLCTDKMAEKDRETSEIVARVEAEKQELINETTMAKAELDSIRVSTGELQAGPDYTSRERFIQLENEFLAFNKFFKEQWKLTRKEIRKQLLWTKGEKKPGKN